MLFFKCKSELGITRCVKYLTTEKGPQEVIGITCMPLPQYSFVQVPWVESHQLRYTKGWRRYSFFMFLKQFLSYHTIGVKCWPGWYFICLAIYLTTIDDNFISIPFIDLAIFSIQWSQGWRFLQINVPTDQVPCKTIGISNLHCALHTHLLTNAKSVVSFEIGIIQW